LRAGLKYKGFDVDILFQGATGNTSMLGGNYYYAFQNNGTVSEVALGRWTPATASTATYPRLSASNNLNNYRSSSFWQRDGGYLSLRSVELGYTLPGSLVGKVKLNSARVFLNGTNLFSIEPEWTSGIRKRGTGYPSVRTFSIGVRVQM
jgi:hypothetical protein